MLLQDRKNRKLKRIRFQLDYDPDKFRLHDLQAGGATAAANSGVPDHLFKTHSCW